MAEKLRYSDAELEEFREAINAKLELAKRDYDQMMRSLRTEDGNDVSDTSPHTRDLRMAATLRQERNLCSWHSVRQNSFKDFREHLSVLRTRHTAFDVRQANLFPQSD